MKAEFRQPYSKDRKPLIELLPLQQPLTMYIDPSSRCNFKCSFCFQNNKDAIKQMDLMQMNLHTFEIIVEQLKAFSQPIKMIHLHGFGEPLLNTNFHTMVKILKQSNVVERVATTSNASLLTQTLTQNIINAELDQIHFSIYGLNDDNYKTFSHKSLRFQHIIDNIQYFYEYKTKYAKHYGHNCHIHIKINKDYFSKSDQQRFLDIFGDYADTIFLDGVANIWPGIDISNSLDINLSQQEKETKAILSHQYGHSITKNAICPNIFYQLMIHSNGNISPCCADYQQKLCLGNIHDTTLYDLWNGGGI